MAPPLSVFDETAPEERQHLALGVSPRTQHQKGIRSPGGATALDLIGDLADFVLPFLVISVRGTELRQFINQQY